MIFSLKQSHPDSPMSETVSSCGSFVSYCWFSVWSPVSRSFGQPVVGRLSVVFELDSSFTESFPHVPCSSCGFCLKEELRRDMYEQDASVSVSPSSLLSVRFLLEGREMWNWNYDCVFWRKFPNLNRSDDFKLQKHSGGHYSSSDWSLGKVQVWKVVEVVTDVLLFIRLTDSWILLLTGKPSLYED